MGILSAVGAGIGAAANQASDDAHAQILSDIEQNRQQAMANFNQQNITLPNIQTEHQNRLDEMQVGANIDIGKQTGLLAANAGFNKQQYADLQANLQPKLDQITQDNAKTLGVDPSDPKAKPNSFQMLNAATDAAGSAGMGIDKVLPLLDKSATAESSLSIKSAMLDIKQQNADSLDKLRDAQATRADALIASGGLKKSDYEIASEAAANIAAAKRAGKEPNELDLAKVATFDQVLDSKHAGGAVDKYTYDGNGNVATKTTTRLKPGENAAPPAGVAPAKVLSYDPASGTFK